MRRDLARLSGPGASNRSPFEADSLTTTLVFRFSVHAGLDDCYGQKKCVVRIAPWRSTTLDHPGALNAAVPRLIAGRSCTIENQRSRADSLFQGSSSFMAPTKTGGITVDSWSRTSAQNIYAIGDVTHRINLTPVAIREGHAFADTMFGKCPVKVDHTNIPTAVFSQPEIGTIGLTEAEARAQFSHVRIYKTDFRPIKSTMSSRDTRVLMKLVVHGITDRVLGCHIVGDAAAEIIQVVAIVVKMNATKADFDATFALHPTAAEELVTMRTPAAS